MSDCLGMHFGSATAATERLQTTNRLSSPLTVVERDDGQWIVEEEIFANETPFEHGPFESEGAAEVFSNLHDASRAPAAFHLSISHPVLLADLWQWGFNAVFQYLASIDLLSDADERDAIWDAWQTSDAQGWESLRGALHKRGFDSIAYVNDVEDKGSISWVALRADQIAPAAGDEVTDAATPLPGTPPSSLGEDLWQRLQQEPIGETMQWLEDNHPDMITRLRRLTVIDDEYRLDKLWAIVPPEELRKLPEIDLTTSIWRGVPKGAKIRPGDWVSLSRSYAEAHGDRTTDHASVDSLGRVECSDIYWAGTDMNEFFYLPKAWRGDGRTEAEHLQSLSRDMVLSFADGELSALARHEPRLDAIRAQVEEGFDEEACGELHGPDHWHRVSYHAVAASRALGISPLVPHVFALVHDSQREHDGFDLEHGPRAAQFIRERRHDLFDFLDDEQIDHLTLACTEQSNGVTEGPAYVQACWDADRLDLGRVGVCPEPRYLCTDYARRPEIIREALRMSGAEPPIRQLHCRPPRMKWA